MLLYVMTHLSNILANCSQKHSGATVDTILDSIKGLLVDYNSCTLSSVSIKDYREK